MNAGRRVFYALLVLALLAACVVAAVVRVERTREAFRTGRGGP